MVEKILSTYEITKDTIFLMPTRHVAFCTTVMERDESYYVKQTPLEIIKAACLEGGSTYDGRRTAVIHKTGVQSKVSIPIDPLNGIFAFPTQSPKQFDCCWLFYHHIKAIQPNRKNLKQSIITFNNYYELTLDVSYTILENQMLRMSYCIVHFSRPNRLFMMKCNYSLY